MSRTRTRSETEQDPQGSDDAGGEAGASETDTPDDLKVVVSIKGGRATIGVQQPSSDPHIESFDDPDLTGLTQEALGGGRKGDEPNGKTNRSTLLTRDPLPRPGAGHGVGRGRRRLRPPRAMQRRHRNRR